MSATERYTVETLAHWRACSAIASKYERETQVPLFVALRELADCTITVLDTGWNIGKRYRASLRASAREGEVIALAFHMSLNSEEREELHTVRNALRWAECVLAGEVDVLEQVRTTRKPERHKHGQYGA